MVRRSPQSYLCGKAIIVAAINSKGLQLDFSSNLEFIMEMEVEAGAVVDKGADGGGGGDGYNSMTEDPSVADYLQYFK